MLYVVYTYTTWRYCVLEVFFPSIAVSFSSSFFHLIPNKTRRGRRTKEENSTDCTVCADRFIQAKMMNLSQTLFALSRLLYHAACGHHVMYSRPSLSLSLSLLYVSITIAIRRSNISSGASIHHRLIGVCGLPSILILLLMESAAGPTL